MYTGSFQDAGTIEVFWRGTVEYEESIEFADAYSFEGVGSEQLEEVVSLGSSGDPGIFLSSMPVDDFLEPTDGFGSVFERRAGRRAVAANPLGDRRRRRGA